MEISDVLDNDSVVFFKIISLIKQFNNSKIIFLNFPQIALQILLIC